MQKPAGNPMSMDLTKLVVGNTYRIKLKYIGSSVTRRVFLGHELQYGSIPALVFSTRVLSGPMPSANPRRPQNLTITFAVRDIVSVVSV
jgi:hypothetical protein